MVSVLIVAGVTTANDYEKEKQFAKLTEIAEAEKTVNCIRRESESSKRLHVDNLVVGDVVRLETGKTLYADAVLIEGHDIEMDESAVTGESRRLTKKPLAECVAELEKQKQLQTEGEIPSHAVPSPVLLSGTKIFKGTGKYMIIVVGKLSWVGQIKATLVEKDTTTPLQNKLAGLAKDISKVGLAAALLTILAMVVSYFAVRIRDGGWSTNDISLNVSYIVIGITVLVVAIPEGLPLAVTISLAYSVRKMYQENNFVKTLMVPFFFG